MILIMLGAWIYHLAGGNKVSFAMPKVNFVDMVKEVLGHTPEVPDHVELEELSKPYQTPTVVEQPHGIQESISVTKEIAEVVEQNKQEEKIETERLVPGKEDQQTSDDFVYKVKGELQTDFEREFHGILTKAVWGLAGNEVAIMRAVRWADVVEVKSKEYKPDDPVAKKAWHDAFREMSQKHIDFVLIVYNTTQPICAIELNDSTHDDPEVQKRDALQREIMDRAGLALLQLPLGQEINQVKDAIEKVFIKVYGKDWKGVFGLSDKSGKYSM